MDAVWRKREPVTKCMKRSGVGWGGESCAGTIMGQEHTARGTAEESRHGVTTENTSEYGERRKLRGGATATESQHARGAPPSGGWREMEAEGGRAPQERRAAVRDVRVCEVGMT